MSKSTEEVVEQLLHAFGDNIDMRLGILATFYVSTEAAGDATTKEELLTGIIYTQGERMIQQAKENMEVVQKVRELFEIPEEKVKEVAAKVDAMFVSRYGAGASGLSGASVSGETSGGTGHETQ